ncbi:luciferase [Hyphomicrobium denitrificans 1NES1]|uniref:Luciferase n=1 Tax=Hyphomicrobium denitrificans 1NES1 TaxID=670307 RepID=N0BAV2_9HYPH|nr:luciferase [Hyphomicrobium denitrificans 1NES1]
MASALASTSDLDPEMSYREMVISGRPESCARRFVELYGGLGIT